MDTETCGVPGKLELIQEECEYIIELIDLEQCAPENMECTVCSYSIGYIQRHLRECLDIINNVVTTDDEFRKTGNKLLKIDNAE